MQTGPHLHPWAHFLLAGQQMPKTLLETSLGTQACFSTNRLYGLSFPRETCYHGHEGPTPMDTHRGAFTLPRVATPRAPSKTPSRTSHFSCIPLPSSPVGISRATPPDNLPANLLPTCGGGQAHAQGHGAEASPGALGGDCGRPGAPSAGLAVASQWHGRTVSSCRTARSPSPEPDTQPGRTVCGGIGGG